ncbi:MAG TPA: hypothetical protein VK152_08325 [Paludibacter sp.]|nr:hypothetical protein [Paludibacter sp.]
MNPQLSPSETISINEVFSTHDTFAIPSDAETLLDMECMLIVLLNSHLTEWAVPREVFNKIVSLGHDFENYFFKTMAVRRNLSYKVAFEQSMRELQEAMMELLENHFINNEHVPREYKELLALFGLNLYCLQPLEACGV